MMNMYSPTSRLNKIHDMKNLQGHSSCLCVCGGGGGGGEYSSCVCDTGENGGGGGGRQITGENIYHYVFLFCPQ